MSTARYDTNVIPNASNNSHSIALRMVGWNQRVLELGAANGSMTRALANQNNKITAVEYDADSEVHLKGVAEAVIIGDLNNPETLAEIVGPFDVVLAGDVLEHLLDPDRVLLQVVEKLAPGGRVVVSLPNIAHADVRMSLLKGRFDYNPVGLLDETHIRFFTHKTIKEFVQRAGLVIVEMERVRIPAFETELRVQRREVPTAVLAEIMADPEAETYQYVFTAMKYDGSEKIADLASEFIALKDELEALRLVRKTESKALHDAQKQTTRLNRQLARTQKELASLRRSKALRAAGLARKVVRKARGAAR